MEFTFFCYARCSTCRKAKDYLDEKGIAYNYREITEQTPTVEELTEWVGRGDYSLKAFFNTSGRSYRELGLKDRLSALSEAEQIQMLAADGMLIKRPILVSPSVLLVGFKAKEWERLNGPAA
ncbi:MAG: arsenate reductase family protein [Firmicutes bacterium]|nr:arsenate reductase family protein [Bacillota bacterium]